MSLNNDWGNLILDSSLVGIGAPIVVKAHEIAHNTTKAHGTMWKWDQTIAKRTMQENFKGTVKMGVVAAVTFAAVSWVSKVTAKSPTGEQAQQTHRTR